MTDTSLKLADASYFEGTRAYARWQQPSELYEEQGVLCVAGATRFPAACTNAAMRINATLAPSRALEIARDFFLSRNRGFTFVTRSREDGDLEAYLLQQELILDSDAPCMLVEKPVAVPAVPNEVRIEWLSTAEHVAHLIDVCGIAYEQTGLPLKQVQAVFSRVDGLLDSRTSAVIAYLNGQAASCAVAVFAENVAGIYWVGTTPQARGRGLGELCTALSTNAGFQRDAKVVALQASKMGEPIYRRLGYTEYDRTRWLRHASPAKTAT